MATTASIGNVDTKHADTIVRKAFVLSFDTVHGGCLLPQAASCLAHSHSRHGNEIPRSHIISQQNSYLALVAVVTVLRGLARYTTFNARA